MHDLIPKHNIVLRRNYCHQLADNCYAIIFFYYLTSFSSVIRNVLFCILNELLHLFFSLSIVIVETEFVKMERNVTVAHPRCEQHCYS